MRLLRWRRPNLAVARVAILLAAGVLTLAGCYNPFSPEISQSFGVRQQAPTPNTARGVLDLFAWCWNNRAYEEYTEIFTEDFEFHFSQSDSAGNSYRNRALYRQDELDSALHLFVEGTASEPPATRILLAFDRTFSPGESNRPGKVFPWHQMVRRNVVLSIDVEDQAFRITGSAVYFVVRGDSALIPEELRQRGFVPDRNRWYIERWEDETLESQGLVAGVDPELLRTAIATAFSRETRRTTAAASAPAATIGPLELTWGRIKHVYRADP